MTIPQAPELSSIVVKSLEKQGITEIKKEFKIITPVFGGGVHVYPKNNEPTQDKSRFKDADPFTPVRVTTIRGQLRFWWRATSSHSDLASLYIAEKELWGFASNPSLVTIEVCSQPSSIEDVEVFGMVESRAGKWNPRPKKGMQGVAYAAFPLQPKGGLTKKLEPAVLHNFLGKIKLTIRCPADKEEEINRAVNAWLLFGGIGGRTRRGFGALENTGLDPLEFLNSLQESLVAISGVPSLKGAQIKVNRCQKDKAIDALELGLKKLLTFRQGVNKGRNPGEGNHPGRSRWPEAENIRNITSSRSRDHQPMTFGTDKFPRAAFGMPIIFHFKDNADPSETTLTPMGKKRRSSSLIIGPYKSGDKYNVFSLVLNDGSRLGEQLVLQGGKNSKNVESELLANEVNWKNSPLGGQPDVLKAFLNFF